MASRVVATIVALMALGAIGWVVFADDTTESAATESAATEGATAEGTAAVDTTADEAASQDSTSEPTDAAESPEPTTSVAETDTGDAVETGAEVAMPDEDAPENFGPRMELVELDGWLNTEATELGDFDGQVLLIEMWTFGCYNCKARIPFNQSYYQEFADENFEIIGVHAPEFDYEADVANIEAALIDLGVTWPVALDTSKKNFRAWQPGSRNFWPRTYVIDQNGDVRYDHIGEGRYEELRETIRYLIENPPAPVDSAN